MARLETTLATAGKALSGSLLPVIDFVYPPRCPACGAGIGAQTGLCLDCWSALEVPAEAQEEAGRIAAATSYCAISRKLILAFKHGRKIALAPLLARLIAARLGEPQSERIIVPVPLHPLRLWQRGYNQSALLGRELAKLGYGKMLVDGLQRVKRTPSLDQRSREERQALLANAILANPKRREQIAGANILLVDDVLTSGATTNACKHALKQAGAARVMIACFARVGGSPKH